MTGGRPHVVVLHRWRDSYAEYESYLDHREHAVTYVSTDVGTAGVPRAATDTEVVAHTDDLAEVRAATARLAARHGSPSAIVALKEDDLLVAALLRAEWGCPGPRYADVLLFRDKYLTCSTARRAGLAVPDFASVDTASDVAGFAAAHGWPVVVKPRSSSSSEGVLVLAGPSELDRVAFGDDRSRMVQVFDERPIYHVDGAFVAGRLTAWKASRYLNTCLGFRHGSVLGSVEEDDPATLALIGEFTDHLLRSLTTAPVVFHLEVFVDDTGCALLEIAARVGGAEISFLWREVHGLDLMRAAFEIGLGVPPGLATTPPTAPVAGWLLVPAPAERPCRIAEVTSMVGRRPGPYAEVVPRAGDVVPAADSYYEHVGGRFRFRGSTTQDVADAITATAQGFRVLSEPMVGARR